MEDIENTYFNSYEDLQIHKLMLEDSCRNQAYKQAIIDNSQHIRGKVVMDVGTGTGILSIMCAQVGAAKVYAIEASDMYKLAQEIIAENNYDNIIQVIHSRIEDLVLPGDEKVDIIVSEWMGFYLLHEGMLDSVLFARDRFLKQDGLMFPESATIYAAPCSIPSMYTAHANVEGISMKSFAKHLRSGAADRPLTLNLTGTDIIATPESIFWCDLRYITPEDLNSISLKHVFVSQQQLRYQGVALWFTCTFPSHGTTEPVILSTDPDDPPTHWKQTVIVLPEEVEVEKDEPIALSIKLSRADDTHRRYTIELCMLSPDAIEHPPYCSCDLTKCILSRAVIKMYENEEQCKP